MSLVCMSLMLGFGMRGNADGCVLDPKLDACGPGFAVTGVHQKPSTKPASGASLAQEHCEILQHVQRALLLIWQSLKTS